MSFICTALSAGPLKQTKIVIEKSSRKLMVSNIYIDYGTTVQQRHMFMCLCTFVGY